MPMAAAFTGAYRLDCPLSGVRETSGSLRCTLNARHGICDWRRGGVIFLHFPLLIIAIYAFNTEDAAFSFPPQGLTLRWFSEAAGRSDILQAVTLSLKIAALSTAIALVLGTLAAGALWRSAFWQNAVSLLLLLPIALPGIITGGAPDGVQSGRP